jgi:DNA (cytosine-5)-methyltransferase 1
MSNVASNAAPAFGRVFSNLKVAGLFAGIGGIEVGLHRAGFSTELLCELDEPARAVLAARFEGFDARRLSETADITNLKRLPTGIDMIAGGFPCQDLSQAGATRGMAGDQSSLVSHVFRLLEQRQVEWVLLENVPFMLQLGRGAAMRYLVGELERLGYRWAYRVLDTRAFGIPQRRQRVFLVASLSADPAELLFRDDVGAPAEVGFAGRACGFYWTEGTRGLGWAVDAIPTLKGGSGLGIPSPPAIWFPDGRIGTPVIDDAERLQGFEADWTGPATRVARPTARWKLVGNAVTVDCAEWVGQQIKGEPGIRPEAVAKLPGDKSWPKAGFGGPNCERLQVDVSEWPVRKLAPSLDEFLKSSIKPLSLKATSGFYDRLTASSLRRPAEFDRALEEHIDFMSSGDSESAYVKTKVAV